jgi:hypothetical protein
MSSDSPSKHPPPEERFKKVLLSLTELMRKELNKARKEGLKVIGDKIVEFGIELIKEADDRSLIKGFITRSFPEDEKTGERLCCWDSVFEKDRDFFFGNSSFIFGELSSGIVDGILVVIRGDESEKNKNLIEGIWKHLFSMIKICINFLYLERKPEIIELSEGGYKIRYTKDKYNFVKLEDLAKKWGVNLLNAK